MPQIDLPYEFILPYPPDECAERLKMEYGDYGYSEIQIRIKPQLDALNFQIGLNFPVSLTQRRS
jgi:hypothetical protein